MKATFPGAYLVDFIPASELFRDIMQTPSNCYKFFLLVKYIPSWVPGASFKRVAKHASSLVFDHITQPFEHTLHKWKEGTQEPSYVSDLLNNAKDADVQNLWGSETEWMEAVKWAAGSMYSAGIDTVSILSSKYTELCRSLNNDLDLLYNTRIHSLHVLSS